MYRKKLTDFIEEYVEVPDEWKYKGGSIMEHMISSCVDVLISENIFTKNELKEQAMKDYGIIIAEKYFYVPVL